MKDKREILFRGKDLDDNWIESMSVGSYKSGIHKSGIGYKLLMKQWEKIEPETLGQYTGLKDKNGVKIFEGDIYQRYNYIYKVSWSRGDTGFVGICIGWYNQFKDLETINSNDPQLISEDGITKVIGNIHDNTELLKQ